MWETVNLGIQHYGSRHVLPRTLVLMLPRTGKMNMWHSELLNREGCVISRFDSLTGVNPLVNPK